MTASPNPLPAEQLKRVLLVEDHAMFRERVAHLIVHNFGMAVCGQTNNAREALEMARASAPDLAIIDLTLQGPSGLELLKDFKAHGMKFPTLVLSMHEESLYAERVIAAGARGYISKNENSETFLKAIQKVLSGKVYLSDNAMEGVLSKMTGKNISASAMTRLADRELEVFQLIGRGRTTREIAETLNLGLTTIDTYRARIKEKLGLTNAAELQISASRWVQEGASERFDS